MTTRMMIMGRPNFKRRRICVFILSAVAVLSQFRLNRRLFSSQISESCFLDAPTAIKSYNNTRHRSSPRFLWGIPSTNTPIEYKRRKAIRETYLSDHRACSFLDYASHGYRNQNFDHCILLYAFFIGANPNGEYDLSDANETIPLTLEIPLLEELLPDSNFTDLVFLNVKENLEEGKITTWFKYAVTAIRTNTHLNKNIDYVVKADSDTLLYTDEFFEAAKMYLPRNPVRVYAGASWHWTEHPLEEIRNATTQFQARGILLHPYILGGLEILSIDLAKYVTSSQLNHTLITDLIGKAEDTLLGELVWSHPQNITLVALNNLPKNGLIWAHQRNTKDPANLRLLWLEYKNRHSNYLN